MLKGLSVWAVKGQENRSAESVLGEVAEHGFEAVEPVFGETGLLTPETTREACEELRRKAEAAGLRMVSLASGLGWRYPLTARRS